MASDVMFWREASVLDEADGIDVVMQKSFSYYLQKKNA
jgi:hypothetical protein